MLFMKKILFISIIIAVAYLSSTLLLNLNNTPLLNVVSTTTTTTPTPMRLFLNKSQNSHGLNVTIEKYDALKVHAKIMKERILKMTGSLPKPITRNSITNHVSKSVHMLYYNKLKNIFDKNQLSKSIYNASVHKNIDRMILLENLKMAQSMGAGVLVFPYPYIPIFPQIETSQNILNTLLNMAPKYNISVAISIREHSNRNILSIRRDIFHFTESYKNHPAVYKYKKKDALKSMPVVYIVDSYLISSEKWKELLGYNGQLTIRNSDIDAVVLGQLQDEEHNFHLRQSNFDGVFTCCNNNGDTFGDTWKNWQSLALWAKSHNLLWSAGVNEGSSGALSIKTGLNTLLRCKPRPNFVLLNNIQLKEDYNALLQTWIDIWSNSSVQNKFL
ncbi:glycoprotein endo-alpha-1,2-mannosidase [Arctopsyche grandis]|uniref:glycoprotein endo-alpha-1,2-mannosidase n=1 Tax=Arctopsyche grandis TaxID=121162 RepID=UPI00406D9392